jgi:hypothetical protein
LATTKKPLSEAATSTPGRTEQTAQRSRVARRRLLVGGIVAVVAIGVLVFLLIGGKDLLPPVLGGDTPETPELDFRLGTVTVVTTTDTRPAQLEGDAKDVAGDVHDTMNTLFQGAFIDPDVWDGDDYEDLFGAVMTEAAAERALADVDTLTLGSGAGDVYDFVEPVTKSHLSVEVLTDTNDKPTQAIARVTFRANTEKDDGTFTQVTVAGSFFLRHEDGRWRVFSYEVDRTERPRTPPATTSGSAEGAS